MSRATAAARAYLETLVADGAPLSVQVTAYGRVGPVVDAWAGAADRATARPADGDAGWPRRARPWPSPGAWSERTRPDTAATPGAPEPSSSAPCGVPDRGARRSRSCPARERAPCRSRKGDA